MNVKELRKIIKNNNLDVKVAARTNGLVKAVAFDCDDLDSLNEILSNYGYQIESFMPGTKFQRFHLEKVGA